MLAVKSVCLWRSMFLTASSSCCWSTLFLLELSSFACFFVSWPFLFFSFLLLSCLLLLPTLVLFSFVEAFDLLLELGFLLFVAPRLASFQGCPVGSGDGGALFGFFPCLWHFRCLIVQSGEIAFFLPPSFT